MPLNTTTFASANGPFDRDMVEEIILVQAAEDMPFYAMLLDGHVGPEAMNEKIEWNTDAHSVRTTAIDNGGAAYTNATTTLVVDDSSVFYEGCLIHCDATGEIMYCVSVDDATTITVRRGVGGVIAAAAGSVANNAVLRNIGPGAGEGRSAYAFRMNSITPDYNYLQTFRKTIALTGRLLSQTTLTENERTRQRKVKFEELIRDFEHALVFGARDNDTLDANNLKVTSMGGLWQHVTTNRDNVGGTMSETRFYSGVEPFFQYGSMEKWALCGQLYLQTINALFRGRVQYVQSDRVVGIQPMQVVLPSGGKLNLVLDRTLSAVYSGAAIIVDPNQCELRFAPGDRGRPALKPVTLANGEDAQSEEWFAEWTWSWGAEKHHGIQYGVTGAA